MDVTGLERNSSLTLGLMLPFTESLTVHKAVSQVLSFPCLWVFLSASLLSSVSPLGGSRMQLSLGLRAGQVWV